MSPFLADLGKKRDSDKKSSAAVKHSQLHKNLFKVNRIRKKFSAARVRPPCFSFGLA